MSQCNVVGLRSDGRMYVCMYVCMYVHRSPAKIQNRNDMAMSIKCILFARKESNHQVYMLTRTSTH